MYIVSAMIYFIPTCCHYVAFSLEALWVVEPQAKALWASSRDKLLPLAPVSPGISDWTLHWATCSVKMMDMFGNLTNIQGNPQMMYRMSQTSSLELWESTGFQATILLFVKLLLLPFCSKAKTKVLLQLGFFLDYMIFSALLCMHLFTVFIIGKLDDK